MWPQFTEHRQDIGRKPRVIGADVGELDNSGGCLHRVTLLITRLVALGQPEGAGT
jgi:hypothetical protein